MCHVKRAHCGIINIHKNDISGFNTKVFFTFSEISRIKTRWHIKNYFHFHAFSGGNGPKNGLSAFILAYSPRPKIMDPHLNKDHNLLLVHEVCNISTSFQKKTCLDLDRKTLICNKS